ncbi:glucose-1-phosphate thymidylyltransferase [Legionella norrlandica]|uniref:Glucose-1-phosphate thymidylyltransferase n=1 Tax=Legionella norrlandica TaxID=1498499 RepID=A0A0A2SX65_9GAMM|nr:glucose-1-phosphate thymidylyltransferase RfbA [Legionella norrlandica]KGP64019.1 glucose-1-phosphate thymidylyltransferase [Legionella norrlandica]
MKGIILAGGSGTRLYPATQGVNKHLIPIYDKPMVYYPLSLLMLTGIREILIITTPEDMPSFQRLLKNGNQWGLKIEYVEQPSPDGLAQAFILGESFLGKEDACLVLGDNIFYGHGLVKALNQAREIVEQHRGACIFGYRVQDPERYGVVEFDKYQRVISLEEKPLRPKSNYAVTGLYFYDNQVCQLAKKVTPSARGELEITCLNNLYLNRNQLNVQLLGRGYAWLDTGTHESLIEASHFVSAVEKRQGSKMGCLEEIAFHYGWINKDQLLSLAKPLIKTAYGRYLMELSLEEENPYIGQFLNSHYLKQAEDNLASTNC